MSKNQKLIDRLLSIPTDFTWDELVTVLAHFGYREIAGGKTGGSRRKFVDGIGHLMSMHKPHPANLLKRYALKEVVATLRETGKLNDRHSPT